MDQVLPTPAPGSSWSQPGPVWPHEAGHGGRAASEGLQMGGLLPAWGLLPPLDRCESPKPSRLQAAFSGPASPPVRPGSPRALAPGEASSWADDGWDSVSPRRRVGFVCV